MLLLVGTSNGWWNLGRKIKICLFVCLDNDMIIWWSSRYYDDPLYCDHLGSSQSSVSKPWLQLSLKARRHLCFSKLLASWLLARVSYPKEIHHECPCVCCCKFLSFRKRLLSEAAFVHWWISFWETFFAWSQWSKIENIYGTMYTQI